MYEKFKLLPLEDQYFPGIFGVDKTRADELDKDVEEVLQPLVEEARTKGEAYKNKYVTACLSLSKTHGEELYLMVIAGMHYERVCDCVQQANAFSHVKKLFKKAMKEAKKIHDDKGADSSLN